MFNSSRIAVGIVGALIAGTFVVSGALAQVRANTAQPAQFKAVAGPQPGDCKAAYAVGMGQNPAMAQAIWTQAVVAQYGANWAHWVGAKNKVVVPVAGGSPQQFMARAQPCFYHPVP
jgi:hypothetical protein